MAREVFAGPDPADLLSLYALTGGVPAYMEFFADHAARTSEAMIRLIFSRRGEWFRGEGTVLLSESLRMDSPAYKTILNAVARGANDWSEISAKTKARDVTVYLSRLEKLFGLIEKRSPVAGRTAGKGVRYFFADPYFRFWYRFVETADAGTLLSRSLWDELQHDCLSGWPSFTEETLKCWFTERLRTEGAWDTVNFWRDKSGKNAIDIVAVSGTKQPALESAGFPDSVQAFPQQTKLLRARLPGRPLHHRNI